MQDLRLDAASNFINASPLILVLGPPADHAEAFKNVDDVVDASAFDPKFFCAAVKQQDCLSFHTVGVKESATKFAQ